MSPVTRLGKYEIAQVLGRGAMGVVFKGFDPGIRRTVAIKTIRRELMEGNRSTVEVLARFRNEARAAGQLAHPAIVAVYDYGEDAEVAYIAMEYIEGNSLREYFDRGTRFGERDVVSIMSQLLDALAHAHDHRVWHRDIKPANLIVMMDGRVKVADFGIARIEASDLTQTGAMLGTPGYMAPEQYAAAAIDHRADIFAAGAVFYQLLTARKPFVGSAEQVAYAICHSDVPRPSLVDPERNLERFDAIVAKALAKRPEDRYKTAHAFRAAIIDAHAAAPAPAVAADTIINEVLRPAASVDLSGPPQATRAATVTAPPLPRGRAWRVVVGLGVIAILAGATWYSFSWKAKSSAPVAEVVVAPAVPAASSEPKALKAGPRPQADQEVVFWESVRSSTDPAELNAYLAGFPEGTFAALARARLESLAATAAASRQAAAQQSKAARAPTTPERKVAEKPAPAELSPAVKARPDQEALFWESVRATNDPAELRAFLARYPDGAFAPLARARLDAMAAAEAKRAADAVAAAEAKRAEDAQRATEAKASAAAAPKALSPPTEIPAPRAATTPTLAPEGLDGVWAASVACESFMELEAFTSRSSTEIRGGEVVLVRGTPGNPGYWNLRGRVEGGSRLRITGTTVARAAAVLGQVASAQFDGHFGPAGYEGAGWFGKRRCTITLRRPVS